MNEEKLVEYLEREQITLASIKKRFFAFVIDEFIVSFLFMFIYFEKFQNATTMEQTILLVNSMFFYIVCLKVIYQTFFVWYYGATPGKIALKIRVMSVEDVANPTIAYAFVRSCMRIVSEIVFYLGFLWGAFDPKRETWHDKIGKTLVVNA